VPSLWRDCTGPARAAEARARETKRDEINMIEMLEERNEEVKKKMKKRVRNEEENKMKKSRLPPDVGVKVRDRTSQNNCKLYTTTHSGNPLVIPGRNRSFP
jgi:hypothetical protein